MFTGQWLFILVLSSQLVMEDLKFLAWLAQSMW